VHSQPVRKLCPERWHALLRRLARTADCSTAAALGSRRTSSTGIAALVNSSVFRSAHLLDARKQGDNTRGMLSGKREPGVRLSWVQESVSPQAAWHGND